MRSGSMSPVLARLHDALLCRGWVERGRFTPWTARNAAVLRGRWEGRLIRVAQWPGDPELTIRVGLRGGPEVGVRRSTFLQRLDPRTSARTACLGRIWIEGHPGGVGRTTRPAAIRLIRTLFNELGVTELHLGRRWARVRRVCDPDLVSAVYFTERLLDLLVSLAKLSDSPLDPRPALRVGLILRCPYCHDSLRPLREPSSSCLVCETLHHEPCALEAGTCTTYGCTSQFFLPHPA